MIHLDGSLLLVGCGRMGDALLQGWLNEGLKAEAVHIVEPYDAAHAALRDRGCHCYLSTDALPADFRPTLVLFAIKPQMIPAALPAYRHFARPETVFLSIAAGTTIASFAAFLGGEAAIVRGMPNTPAAVGRGMTVLVANAHAATSQRDLCGALLAAVGETAWVEEESLLDAVTAVSGSGPAYVFHLVECMAAAGRAAGLPEKLAMRLARATVSGAGELLYQAPEEAAQLRRNVTSPGGTTQAALEVLMADAGLAPLVARAVTAAADRSRELAV